MKKVLVIVSLIVVASLTGYEVSNKFYKTNTPQVKGVTQQVLSLSPQQFSDSLNSGDYILLDIRTQEEYDAGHIKNAKQIDYYQTQAFSDYLNTLDKKANYLIYCRTGKRSSAALQLMQSKGFENVTELSGGYNAWVTDGFPVTK